MSAIAIARAIKDLIELHVDARTTLVRDAVRNDNGVWVQNANEYSAGDRIALKSNDKVELHTIQCTSIVDGLHSLTLCENVTTTFATDDAYVQKLHNGQAIQETILGNPETIASYPAITIEAQGMNREPLTLSTVSDQYTIAIGVWCDATNFTDAYSSCLILTDLVTQAIYKDLYPLTEPFIRTTLTEEVAPTDSTIEVVNAQGLIPNAWVWLVNNNGAKRHNQIVSVSDESIDLTFAVGSSFKIGDTVTRPLTRLYDPRVEHISFDDSSGGDLLLKSSTITYTIKLHRPRVR